MVKRVYRFGEAQTDGSAQMRELLGGKGCNLAEMCNLGLRVPPGFTITTETCRDYNAVGKEFPPGLWDDVLLGIAAIEAQSGKKFGEPNDPLLVSVRSGAAVSMPGMMDTVLNLGLNDQSVEGLACKTELRFAYDSYRRLLDMFGDVVLGIPHSLFEVEMEALKKSRGVEHDSELSALDLKELVDKYKQIYIRQAIDFPQHPERQLELAIRAVFNSWDIPRAKTYREINSITGLLGTAVNVQTMAFGNQGPTSATGVLFSRDPSTGEGTLYGEYLLNAQGEDVVAGIRTPCPLKDLAMAMPEVYAELESNVSTLERHFKDMQDIEFTIQDGRLFMLQCRNGKRTGAAAIRIAVEMYQEGLVSKDESLQLVRPEHVDQMLHPQFASKPSKDDLLGKGLPASPGAAVGRLVFHSEDAVRLKRDGDDALLVRTETCADDIGGMHAAKGILTQRGGMTSHAAVVARGWGKPCVCGCTEMAVDEQAKTLSLGGKTLREGEWVSINGSSGEVIVGRQPLKPASFSAELASFMQWADDRRALRVFANADTPEDAAEARRNGAQGIGLVRTEHMFFASEERIRTVRQMIMAEDLDGRLAALAKLLPFQRSDFEGIFEAMDGLPVTVRLLDPPLHEFLPKLDMPDVVAAMAAELGVSVDNVRAKIVSLSEVNPMLGLRGCRLGIQRPEITEMQARAVFEAALNVLARGVTPVTDIMVPLVGSTSELKHQTKVIRDTAARVFAERGASVAFRVGTMMEIPRACLLADEVAACTDFFSFGTNDLTQMTFGFSRDDMASFMPTYLAAGIIDKDPFQVLDRRGVGQLIATAVTKGRNANGNLKIGICGEHGGDPSSIEFCHQQGLNYVSCSPFRVPIARLAAAQARVATETKTDTTTGPQQTTTTTTTTTTKGAVVASGKGALPAEVSSGELQKGTAA